ncbi:hypothetical protein ECZC04_55700 [Escherichia coli]|nr:hypothetical protein ECZC04_55700 [Escherichia coli]
MFNNVAFKKYYCGQSENRGTISADKTIWCHLAFSEDDKNWYEEQKSFARDTIKMVYTGDGRVVWVGKDVTGIEPRNASVIEVPDITANRRITAPGYWFYRNDEFVFDYKLKAEDERDALLKQVSIMTSEWEKDLLLGLISDEDRRS